MKTLALTQGDLTLAQGGYQLFTGVDRIRQDLRLALQDEFGTDRFHPGWGSIVMRYIGNVLTSQLQALVRAEVNRVINNYCTIQQAEVLADSVVDVAGRFTTSDVVRSIVSITATAHQDRIDIAVVLETLARETVTIKSSMSA